MLNVRVIVVEPKTEAAMLDDTAVIVRDEMLNKEHSRFLFMSKHRSVVERFMANVRNDLIEDKAWVGKKSSVRLFNESSLKVLTFDDAVLGFRVGSYNQPDHGGMILDCTDMKDDSISAHFQDHLIARIAGRKTTIVVLVGPHSKPFKAEGVIATQIIADWNAALELLK